jgi:hypothetical protein
MPLPINKLLAVDSACGNVGCDQLPANTADAVCGPILQVGIITLYPNVLYLNISVLFRNPSAPAFGQFFMNKICGADSIYYRSRNMGTSGTGTNALTLAGCATPVPSGSAYKFYDVFAWRALLAGVWTSSLVIDLHPIFTFTDKYTPPPGPAIVVAGINVGTRSWVNCQCKAVTLPLNPSPANPCMVNHQATLTVYDDATFTLS